MIADEAALLDEAVRAADAICARLELLAREGGALSVLLALAENHREAVLLLCDQAGLPREEAPRRMALAESALTELRDIAVAAATQFRELTYRECSPRRRACRRQRTRPRGPCGRRPR